VHPGEPQWMSHRVISEGETDMFMWQRMNVVLQYQRETARKKMNDPSGLKLGEDFGG
jgi:hypothetical protein